MPVCVFSVVVVVVQNNRALLHSTAMFRAELLWGATVNCVAADGNDWQFMFSLGQATAADGKTPVGLEVAETDAARVTRWMQEEEAPYVHGYYEQDWADGIMHVRSAAHAFPGKPTQEILKRSGDNSTVLYWADGVTQASKPHARFFGLNLLSELDSAGEYHLSRTSGLLHYLPALPLEQWDNTTGIPVWSVNETAVFFAPGTASVSLSGVTVAHATNLGVSGAFVLQCASASPAGHALTYFEIMGCRLGHDEC